MQNNDFEFTPKFVKKNSNKDENKTTTEQIKIISMFDFLFTIKITTILLITFAFFIIIYSTSKNMSVFSNKPEEIIEFNSKAISDAEFLKAIQFGSLQQIEEMLKNGANPKAVDEKGRNAFILASLFNGKPQIVDILKKYNVDINAKDKNGYDSLMLSIISDNSVEFSQKLINNGININSTTNTDISSLMVALGTTDSDKLVKDMLKAGANINYKNKSEITPLMIAAKITQNPKIIEALLQNGANKNAKDKYGISIYEIAKSNKALQNNKTLLNKLK